MSESGPNEGYRISRTLEAIDREIRRRNRRHAEEEKIPPFEPGSEWINRDPGPRLDGERSVMAGLIRNAPISTHARLLLSDGISLPCPESLRNGEEVQVKLWEVIDALAARRVFLYHTNHLTNRELYVSLWTVHLNEVTRDISAFPSAAWHIDLLGCGTRHEDVSDGQQEFWPEERSFKKIPPRRKPAYDRDRYLPKRR